MCWVDSLEGIRQEKFKNTVIKTILLMVSVSMDTKCEKRMVRFNNTTRKI